MKKYKIGIFGGSFDPIHKGHVKIVKAAKKELDLDFIYIVPALITNYVNQKQLSFPGYRLDMIRMAFKKYEWAKILEYEIDRLAPSYTVDTLRYIKDLCTKENKMADFYFIMGADAFLSFNTWKESETILELATLAVGARAGYDDIAVLEQKTQMEENNKQASIVTFKSPKIDLSSTQIRDLSAQQNIEILHLKKSIRTYIQLNGLYTETTNFNILKRQDYLTLVKLERKLSKRLSEHRYIHSLNVSCTAMQYAAHYQLPVEKAGIAGLLHDCAKELSQKAMLTLCPELKNRTDFPVVAWHSEVGSVLAKQLYEVSDPEILRAIQVHTTLDDQVSPLDKIVYLADKLEPARDYAGVDNYRKMVYEDLDKTIYYYLEDSFKHLEQNGRKPYFKTVKLMEKIRKELKKGNRK